MDGECPILALTTKAQQGDSKNNEEKTVEKQDKEVEKKRSNQRKKERVHNWEEVGIYKNKCSSPPKSKRF